MINLKSDQLEILLSVCLELLRMAKSLTGRPTCLLWFMRTIQRAMKTLGTCLIF